MEWSEYYSDLKIPSKWVNVSYANDLLPSFITTEDEDGVQIFIDSHDLSVRAENTMEATGQNEDLLKRFAVVVSYGEGEPPVFETDNFDLLLKFLEWRSIK